MHEMLTIGKCLQNIKTKRCGIIPYTISYQKGNFTKKNCPQLLFLLSRHKKTKELGDFGGGVKQSESAATAGIREFHEETREIFSDIYQTPADIMSAITLIDVYCDMAIIFVPVDPKWVKIAQNKFLQTKPSKKSADEVCDIIWVTETMFSELIFKRNRQNIENNKECYFSEDNQNGADLLWKRIRLFLQKSIKPTGKFYQCLRNHALQFLTTAKSMSSQN